MLYGLHVPILSQHPSRNGDECVHALIYEKGTQSINQIWPQASYFSHKFGRNESESGLEEKASRSQFVKCNAAIITKSKLDSGEKSVSSFPTENEFPPPSKHICNHGMINTQFKQSSCAGESKVTEQIQTLKHVLDVIYSVGEIVFPDEDIQVLRRTFRFPDILIPICHMAGWMLLFWVFLVPFPVFAVLFTSCNLD